MDFLRWARTYGAPAGEAALEPLRFGTVRSELYSGNVVTIPVPVVSRAPAPPATADWLCVRQTLGHGASGLPMVRPAIRLAPTTVMPVVLERVEDERVVRQRQPAEWGVDRTTQRAVR